MSENLPIPETWRPFVVPPDSENAMSAEISELAVALAKAQAAMHGAMKDAINPHFKSSYADLSSVWDAIREPLTANGLSVTQFANAHGEKVSVTTLLLHTSGQWLRSTLSMAAINAGPQSIGSALTYARRYGLSAMVGVAPEDDDGNAASQKLKKEREQQTVRAEVVQATPAVSATIPDGFVRVLEVQAGQWGKAKGQVVLVDNSGAEGKYAVFADQLVLQAQQMCSEGTLVRPDFKVPKNGGKTYLAGLYRDGEEMVF